jgi:hypothetical protein
MKYILILLSTLFFACGARKVNKQEKVEEKTTVEVVVQKDSVVETTNTDIKYDVETNEIEVTPIDSTKEFTVEGKKYFNARIKIKKKKDNTIYSEDNKVSKTSLKQSKTLVKELKKDKTKAVDKKASYSWLYWLLFLLLALYLLWKNKTKLVGLL